MLSTDPIELNQDGNEENEAPEQTTQATPVSDSTEETLKEENETIQEDLSSQETVEDAVEQPVAEVEEEPEVPAVAEIVAEETAVEEATTEEVVAKADAAVETTEEVVAEAAVEAEAAEEVAAEVGEEAEDDSPLVVGENFSEEAMLQQIDQILENETNLDQLIESASPHEMIFMLDHFYKAEEVRPYIRRVGLIKRAFDGLREKAEQPPEVLARFSTALARFNKKRSEYQAAQDEIKETNSEKKRKLISSLKEIVDTEDVNKIDEVREIQSAWKKVGYVKREDMEELFREYRFLLDTFYKNRELHFQLRDYDRQINLQEKERLLEELQTIIPEEEERENRDIWVSKNDLLTDIQMRWRSVGHVPREDLDRINDSYREITGQFFAIRREFFENQDEAKKENEDQKRELLEQMKAYEEYQSEKPKEWNHATDKLRELQEKWKEIGPAPKEVNSELWKEYRNVGNAFFGKKADFFRQLDEKRNENLERKRELCEKAEAIKDNEDFEKTAKELRTLQEEWKKVGPVPERYSNKLWARFRAACDVFFNARREHYSSRRNEEEENLNSKKELIEEVRKISVEEAGGSDKAIELVKDIQARWKAIGRVPYKDKDTIWKEFRKEIDQFFDDLRGNRDRSNYVKLKEKVESLPEDKRSRALKGRIDKLRRKMDAVREKVEQYSTNIQFISKGKSGDGLRNQIQKEIDKETRALEDMRKQLKQLNEMLRNPKPEEAEEEVEENVEAKVEAPVEAKAENTPEATEAEDTEAVEAEEPEAEEPEAEEEKPAE